MDSSSAVRLGSACTQNTASSSCGWTEQLIPTVKTWRNIEYHKETKTCPINCHGSFQSLISVLCLLLSFSCVQVYFKIQFCVTFGILLFKVHLKLRTFPSVTKYVSKSWL